MTFQDAIRTCLGKYATFSGRATRPEYWWFVLFYYLGVLGFSKIDAFGARPGVFGSLFALIFFLPLLAALVRRLRDTDRSGYWAFLCLVPVIGPVVVLIMAAQPSS